MAGVRTVRLGASPPSRPARAAATLRWRRLLPEATAPSARAARPARPLRRAAGHRPAQVARGARRRARPTLVYLSGGPAARGIEEMLAVMPLEPSCSTSTRRRLRPARDGGSGLLRCPALERDARLRSRRAGERARRLGRAARALHDARLGRGHGGDPGRLGAERLTLFGISYGTELALAYARAHPDRVDRLILDSVVDPDDRDPFGLAGFRAMGPSLAGCARPLPRRHARSAGRPGGAGRRGCAPRRCAGSLDGRGRGARGGRGRPRSPTCCTTPTTTRRCARACPRRARRARAATRRAAAAAARRGRRPRRAADARATFSTARYATVCEETPLPWDAATPLADRLGRGPRRATGARRRPRSSRSTPTSPRRRDRPLPALARRAVRARAGAGGAVPGRAGAAAPGRRGPAHAARGLRARRDADPGRAARDGARRRPRGGRRRPERLRRARAVLALPARAGPTAGLPPRRRPACRPPALPPRALAAWRRCARLRGGAGRTAAARRRDARRPRLLALAGVRVAYSGGGLRGGRSRCGAGAARAGASPRSAGCGSGARRARGVLRLRVGGGRRARAVSALRRPAERAARAGGGSSVRRTAAGLRRRSARARRRAVGDRAAERPPRRPPPPRAAPDAAFRAPSAIRAKSSRPRLVPSPAR